MTEPAAPHGQGSSHDDAPTFGERLRAWLRGLGLARATDESLREGLEELLEEHAESVTPETREERTLLRNILRVSELRVGDIMVPRADIVGVEESASLEQVLQIFRVAAHSRLPVYRNTLDDVMGMVHVKDLLPFWNGGTEQFKLAPLIRKLLFVAPSMPVLDLLLKMRASQVHLALVVDEYGGVDGLVSIEDLVEQIVGEIHDEHDVAEGPYLIEAPNGTLEADARCSVQELEDHLGVQLLDEDHEEVETLGGLVFSLLGRVPLRGELVSHPVGLAFEVIDADPRRIKRLRVRNLDALKARDDS